MIQGLGPPPSSIVMVPPLPWGECPPLPGPWVPPRNQPTQNANVAPHEILPGRLQFGLTPGSLGFHGPLGPGCPQGPNQQKMLTLPPMLPGRLQFGLTPGSLGFHGPLGPGCPQGTNQPNIWDHSFAWGGHSPWATIPSGEGAARPETLDHIWGTV